MCARACPPLLWACLTILEGIIHATTPLSDSAVLQLCHHGTHTHTHTPLMTLIVREAESITAQGFGRRVCSVAVCVSPVFLRSVSSGDDWNISSSSLGIKTDLSPLLSPLVLGVNNGLQYAGKGISIL